jgi:glc operon protein GlcG
MKLAILPAAILALSGLSAPARAAPGAMLVSPPTLSSADARKLLAQSIAVSKQRGYHLCLAIEDGHGGLLAFDRDDEAAPGCVAAAIAKATSAATNGADTEVFLAFARDHNPALGAIPGIVPAVAGVVLRKGDAVVGSLGIAGGPSDAEEKRFADELRQQLQAWLD